MSLYLIILGVFVTYSFGDGGRLPWGTQAGMWPQSGTGPSSSGPSSSGPSSSGPSSSGPSRTGPSRSGPDPRLVTISGIQYAGSGCPAGSVAQVIDPSRTVLCVPCFLFIGVWLGGQTSYVLFSRLTCLVP
eukprot:TRINITY_DN4055_c0_g1_i6.p1 TRINITY_DN4055_c0_g1~~TRINITY_DN4055_c0_g1_i6.p1  ORF type:complete len:131 (+),score=12.88 TRINITY_DN4055_c0_g1_i6:181-573(+)